MRRPIARLLFLPPVLALLSACTGPAPEPSPDRMVMASGSRATYVTVEAKLDATGNPIFGPYHDTELVRPGDTLEFRCACAPGLEFKVSAPRLVANKDAFWEELLEANPEATRTQVAEARQWLGNRPPGPAPPDQPDPPAAVFLARFLKDFQKVIPNLPKAQVFADWREPDFHRGDAAIGPFEVAAMKPGQAFASTWKFAWTIRAAGEQDPAKWVVLDPHIEWEPFQKDF